VGEGENHSGITEENSGRVFCRAITSLTTDFNGSKLDTSGSKVGRVAPIEVDTSTLPVVGVLDTGVPANHVILNKYERGKYISPTSAPGVTDDHGSFVSSRVVFGDPDYSGGLSARPPGPRLLASFDINVRGTGGRRD